MHASRWAFHQRLTCSKLVFHKPSEIRAHKTAVKSQKTALFLGQVWPERTSSAAGVRTAELLNAFERWGWDVAFLSSATANEHTELLEQQGCRTFHIPPNREQAFKDVLEQLRPAACIFDRFYTEEAYSFRVRDVVPDSIRILDMQDMHSLRRVRQAGVEQGKHFLEALTNPPTAAEAVLHRELASIHRSDLTLVCSPVEQALLQSVYQTPAFKLCLAPFFVTPSAQQTRNFGQRSHFMTIGNWKHPPNRDAVQWLCQKIWPQIRQQLPKAELHIYGAYMGRAAQQYHKPVAGVHGKGFAPSLDIMQQYKVCLAPLRYGAGLKGKIVDSWLHGLPVCTTPVGAEGVFPATSYAPEGFPDTGVYQPPASFLQRWFEAGTHLGESVQEHGLWGGLWTANSAESFAANAVSMYTSEKAWQAWQQQGFSLLSALYAYDARLQVVKDAVESSLECQNEQRSQDYLGSMLWSQQMRATEYFSRWLELKESIKS